MARDRHTPEQRKRSRDKWYAKRREIINSFKCVPCADCGVQYESYVMQFDHVRGEKLFSIGESVARAGVSLQGFYDEIEKCEVVCANCHAARTYERAH